MAGDWSGVEFGWSFKMQTRLSQSLSWVHPSIPKPSPTPPKIPALPFPSSLLTFPATSASSRVPGFVLCRASPCFSDVYIWISLTVGVLDFRRTLHCGKARSRASFPSLCQGQDSLGVQQVALAVPCTAVLFPGKWDTGFGGVTSSDTSNPSPQVNWDEALLCSLLTIGLHVKQRSLLWSNLPTRRGSVLCDRSARYCCSYFCCASHPNNVLVFRWQWIWPNASSLMSSYRWVGEQLGGWLANNSGFEALSWGFGGRVNL